MAIYKCKMCGGTLEINSESVATCEYCGTQQTLPKTNDTAITNLFNRANNLRLKCEFDKAAQVYEKIVQQNDSEAEAHWGIVLCKYGIEYVEDPKTFTRIPTCHRTLFEPVTTDADYLAAIDYSDAAQQVIYEQEARAIDRLQKDILAIVKNEKPFDVFLCYKQTDEYGKRTSDSVIANDIYHQLTQEGLKVFYAAITLEDKLGQAYEPYIFAALNSAKVMLVIGTKPEYFNAVWVKNEWSRFLKLMKTDRSKLLIPCYKDMDAYDLPEEFSHLQAQDMGRIGFINDVVRGIKKVTQTFQPEALLPFQSAPSTPSGASMIALLDRGNMALEDGSFDKANEYFDQVLNMDARCGEAYLGQLLAANKVSNIRAFVQKRLADKKRYVATTMSACPEDEAFLEDAVAQYEVPGFLEASDLWRKLENFDRSFLSQTDGQAARLQQEELYQTTDVLFCRTRKFLTGEAKQEFERAANEILTTLTQHVSAEKKHDAEETARISREYRAFLEKTAAEIKELSKAAKQARQRQYDAAVAAMENAEDFVDYNKAAELFLGVPDYLDSDDRAAQCRVKARGLEYSWDIQQKRLKLKKQLICIAAAAAVIAIILSSTLISQNNQRQELRQNLVGKTFSGTYRWNGGYYDCVEKIEVTFVDAQNCTVTVTRTEKSSSRGSTSNTYVDSNVPYALTGAGTNFSLTWKSNKVHNYPAEPFVLVAANGQIMLATDNWNSNVGVTLY